MRKPLRIVLVAGIVAASAAGCSSSSNRTSSSLTTSSRTPASTVPRSFAVGAITETFTDTSRPTPASGDVPERSSRTLPTTIFYPATGSTSAAKPVDHAPPAITGGPYPLIVFGHGFAANPAVYQKLLTHWAAAGFVVAAPTFPLSSSSAPGGPDAGDVASQPGDMSFVIDQVLQLNKANDGPLARLVEPTEIGAAGHSYGAVTTTALVGNTCCRDKRIKAAVIMAGAMSPFGGGRYDLAAAPPLLVVHGTDDTLIPYRQGVEIFNAAHGPKTMLTIEGGDHMAAAALADKSATLVEDATTDFFDGHLRDDPSALDRLAHAARRGIATMTNAPKEGSTVTIPLPKQAERNLHATATPTDGLSDGQTITVTWSGYTAGKVVNILQCSAADADLTNQSGCDFSHAKLLHADPTGSGSLTMEVITGKVGTGQCGADHPGCFIVVNDASSPDPADMVRIPITFAE